MTHMYVVKEEADFERYKNQRMKTTYVERAEVLLKLVESGKRHPPWHKGLHPELASSGLWDAIQGLCSNSAADRCSASVLLSLINGTVQATSCRASRTRRR